jgi:hypothetical protein
MAAKSEGMLLASHCITLALIKHLVDRGLLTPGNVLDITGHAEEILATLDPSLMTPDGRDGAKIVLQLMQKISST